MPTARPPSSLEIQLLGRFRVAVDGVDVEEQRWGRRQAKALIKLLALSPGRRLHREQLQDALWPSSSPDSASNSLNKVIHMARRALEPRLRSGTRSLFISRRSGQVMLRAPESLRIDIEQFEKRASEALSSQSAETCDAALSLYRGNLLLEDIYEEWSWGRREQLSLLHQNLLWKAARIYSKRGDHQASIDRLTELLAREPTHERAHRSLMKAYASIGHRDKALRQYQRCTESVGKELDAEPETATTELHRLIASGKFRTETTGETAFDPTHAHLQSLAVLPFVNNSADPELDYLCEGLAESLIKILSQLPSLRVMALSTVLRATGKAPNSTAIVDELGVQAVLTGRVTQWSERLVVSVELVRSSDGSLIWGEQYNRTSSDIFEVQDEISNEIFRKLRVQLTGRERRSLARRHTRSPEAFRLYMKGRHHWNKRTSEGLTRGLSFFQKAIDADPSYALAYSGLADSYALMSLYSVASPVEVMPKAKAAVARGLEIDDSLAEVHTSQAYTRLYYDWDWPGTQEAFQRAFDLNPNYPTAHHWYHEFLTAMGRFDEQSVAIRRAAELDPLSPIIQTEFGWGFYYARDYDRAVRHLRNTLRTDPEFPIAHLILGLVYQQTGAPARALEEIEWATTLVPVDSFPLALGILGHAYASVGNIERARRIQDRLDELSERDFVSAYVTAVLHTGLGEKEAALKSLEQAVDERYDRLIYLSVEPLFDSLRSETRFRSLLDRIGLDEPGARRRA